MNPPRFQKETMIVGSPEYKRLLELEISSWGTADPQNNGGWPLIRKTISYKTYRRGTIETQLAYIAEQGINLDLLELGSADGWFSNEILNLSNVRSMTSIDVSLSASTSKSYRQKVKLIKGDLNLIEEIEELRGKKFDCILTRGTLHHLVDPRQTLLYATKHLLKEGGILIVEDSWIRQSLQFKTNAFLSLAFYVVPHSIFDYARGSLLGRKHESLAEIWGHLRDLGSVIIDNKRAEALAHNQAFSPFESISAADDYSDLYKMEGFTVRYFKNFAALPAWHHTYLGRLKFLGRRVIQPVDTFLIWSRIFVGDLHLCVLQKNKLL